MRNKKNQETRCCRGLGVLLDQVATCTDRFKVQIENFKFKFKHNIRESEKSMDGRTDDTSLSLPLCVSTCISSIPVVLADTQLKRVIVHRRPKRCVQEQAMATHINLALVIIAKCAVSDVIHFLRSD